MYGKLDNGGTTVGDSVTSIQTAADIKANGLDDAKTSYVEYRVEAPAAGTYTLRVGAVGGRKCAAERLSHRGGGQRRRCL